MNFLKTFKELGAIWQHDRHPDRPYALLTSGKISDFFFNASKVIEQPRVLGAVSDELVRLAKQEDPELSPDFVVGPAQGAISLAHEVAGSLPPARSWFTELPKNPEDGTDQELLRFEPGSEALLGVRVEDVVTTGGSAMKTKDAVLRRNSAVKFAPFLLCIVNRSGSPTLSDGTKIISLISVTPKTWDRGSNPFVPGRGELVEPVRPKVNWDALTRAYD
ncbi:MAG TPA: hypothetical protein VHD31_03185 [Candidatus Paceibacterota bacterium]|nr:hypothetical protein [Candidatus Paceibacterota bacterium]